VRTIRARLALWLSIGGSLLLTTLFVVIDMLVDYQLYSRFDTALIERGRALANIISAREFDTAGIAAWWPEFSAARHQDYYEIWDERGMALVRADSNKGRELSRPTGSLETTPKLFDLTLPDGHRGRGVALVTWQRVSTTTEPMPRTIVIASERESLDALERRIHFGLILSAVVGVVLMVGVSLAAIGAGLRPLREFGEDTARRALAPGADAGPVVEVPDELVPIRNSLDSAFGALREALARERRFARAVAHELRTPLAEMSTMLERDCAPVDDKRIELRAALNGMTRTVEGLLALARYEAGLEAPAIEPVDVVAVLARQAAALRVPSAARGQQIAAVTPEELWVMSDAALLERIFANLIGNSVDHGPEECTIEIAVQSHDGLARVTIANPAPMLSATDAARLGEPEFRPATGRDGKAHVGLGVVLASAIAAQLGLTLKFELRAGQLLVGVEGLTAL
jgi:signal transduction histidine kinase